MGEFYPTLVIRFVLIFFLSFFRMDKIYRQNNITVTGSPIHFRSPNDDVLEIIITSD